VDVVGAAFTESVAAGNNGFPPRLEIVECEEGNAREGAVEGALDKRRLGAAEAVERGASLMSGKGGGEKTGVFGRPASEDPEWWSLKELGAKCVVFGGGRNAGGEITDTGFEVLALV